MSANDDFAAFNNSFSFDQLLFAADIRASIAHCGGLLAAGVVTAEEHGALIEALRSMRETAAANPEYFNELSSEDIHSFIEARLVELIGDVGHKIHTGRSRNDQVVTALRLWLREEIDLIIKDLSALQLGLVRQGELNIDATLPGYTHLQKAQPILWAHWCLAYYEMLSRDRERLANVRARTNIMPLGSAALAGSGYEINRQEMAQELGFDRISQNSLDAVSDRDFCIEFAAAAALIMAHLSRLAEDIILYSSAEFGFLELSDSVATGSSLMPQKKNPDAMELVRGKTGRVFGHLQGLLTMIKGLPLAYNKDLQEDKEAVFDIARTVRASINVTTTVMASLTLHHDVMMRAAQTGYMNATELVDYLVRKGVAFRKGHNIVGRVVLRAIELRVELQDLSLAELQRFSRLIEADVFDALSLKKILESKNIEGGTSPQRVRKALRAARRQLES